jgi:Fe-S cluster assembly protein SufD
VTQTTHEHVSSLIGSYDPDDFPVPSGREEQWRFTPLRQLRGLVDGSAAASNTMTIAVDAPAGVRTEQVSSSDERARILPGPTDRAAALAASRTSNVTVVTIEQDVVLTEPVWIRCTGANSVSATFQHIVIDVKPFAQAVIVIDRSGSVCLSDLVDVRVADGAQVTVVSLQDWASDSVHLGQQRHLIGRDASCTSVVITLGGQIVRLVPTVVYDAPGGSAHMFGLFFAREGQFFEHRLFVDHAVPNCTSRVTYKGALQGTENHPSHTVWIGDVLIRSQAVGTDTYEINRNLVLTDHARADSVPNLEIETGEVAGAGHASATGRFDDEQLFYLQARGITAEEARRLVVRGFFHEILQQIGIEQLQARLVARVEGELEGHGV